MSPEKQRLWAKVRPPSMRGKSIILEELRGGKVYRQIELLNASLAAGKTVAVITRGGVHRYEPGATVRAEDFE